LSVKEEGMTRLTVISRHYQAREPASGYLASRAFRRILEGWRNGGRMERADRNDRDLGPTFGRRTHGAPHSNESV
jgi:hypothetical protein